MNTLYYIRKLAKLSRFQNLFVLAKDVNGIYLFRNKTNISFAQNFFINYLYTYELINRDLHSKKISKHVIDNELYEDAYLLYKNESEKQTDTEEKSNKDVKLVMGNKIKFPNKDK